MSSLAPPVLDDVAFRDLANVAIERIPAESGGRWTLHSPVDPGITLLELYAYLLDQRLYWLNEIPDALLRGVLRLLGFEPAAVRSAATVLRIVSEGDALRRVPSRVRFVVAGSDPELAFTTAGSVQLLPVERVGVRAFGADRSEDLARGRAVPLLPADGSDAEARLVLHMSADPAPAAGRRATLLLRLDETVVPAQWLAPDDVPVPPPATIGIAFARTGATVPAALPPASVEDGTGGLRRTGILRFVVPDQWAPDGGPGADGLVPYSLLLRTGAATFTSPPRLVEAVPNVVVARHVVRMRLPAADIEDQVAQWLPLPGCTIDCRVPGTLIERSDTTSVRLKERDGRWHDWDAVGDFAFSGPGDRVFVADRAAGRLQFGDGLTGRLPVLHRTGPRARVTFDLGGGPAGNVASNLLWEAPARPELTAQNVVEAAGGAEPETLEETRSRAAEALLAVERAVTARDYRTLAETTPGIDIARAQAAVGLHPGHPCDPVPGAITVFVVPGAPRERADFADPLFVGAPEADPGALAAVAARIESARLVGNEVFVRNARYRRVDLLVTVSAQPADPDRLRTVLEDDLRIFLDPLVGGDEASGRPFGEPLRPSALLRRAQSAVGTEAPVASVAIGLDGGVPDEDCRELEIGPNDLVWLHRVAVRWAAQSGQQGGLL